jgi:hypothetical protein
MFSLKFMKTLEDGRPIERCVECKTYEVIECEESLLITIYEGYTNMSDGVDYCLSTEDPKGYDHCFVENSNGKTVNKYTCLAIGEVG